jgi:tRNA1Val (adenine37-N6)-methyltransferase
MSLQADFRFKKFNVAQQGAAHPVGTDSVLLGSWAGGNGQIRKILDIGTGTGILAMMLAQRFSGAAITAIEPDMPSLTCAKQNFGLSPWANRFELLPNRLQDFCNHHTASSYDLIVSNPPFFINALPAATTARTIARHSAALPFSDLIKGVAQMLQPQGQFCVVLPVSEALHFRTLAATLGLYYSQLNEVKSFAASKTQRMLMTFSKNPLCFQRECTIIYDYPGQYSNQYRMLTKDFYLWT